MSEVELVPLDKGNRLVLDNTIAGITTVGRTQNIGCVDKKISRNHAELHIKSDGTLWIKPIHHNPTFYRTKANQLITLTKDEEFQLHDNDEIGLLPNEYFYRISIKSNDKQEESTNSLNIPKSPVQEEDSSSIQEKKSLPLKESSVIEKEHSPVNNLTVDKPSIKNASREPEGGVILHTSRSLPAWMSKTALPEPKTPKGRGKGKQATTPTKPTPSPSKHRTYIGRKKVESIEYGEDEESDDEPVKTTVTSSDQSNKTSSAVTGSAKRERCPYGKFCYRKNPMHRQEAIHPGDPDWDNKENDADEQKPVCPYGSECYRKNPEHFNEFSHTQKGSSANKPKQRPSKRKGSDNEEEDDDGLPNEYDYSDSFIDDAELDDSGRTENEGGSQKQPEKDWKPNKKVGQIDDDSEDGSQDEDEIDLLKREAARFVQDSSIHDQRPAKKKARLSMPDQYD